MQLEKILETLAIVLFTIFAVITVLFISYNFNKQNVVPDLSSCKEYKLCTQWHGEYECLLVKTREDFKMCDSIIPSTSQCITAKYIYSIKCNKEYLGKNN